MAIATASLNQAWQDKHDVSRFSVAFVLSIALHLLLAWLITYQRFDPPIPEKQEQQIMDVVLLDESQPSLKQQPSDSNTIANKNNSGRSVDAQDKMTRMARAPLQTPSQAEQKKPQPPTPQMPKKPLLPKQQTTKQSRVVTRESDDALSLLRPEHDKVISKQNVSTPAVPYIPMSELLSLKSALTQTSSDFQRERRMKEMLSQEDDIGINTTEAKYAPYAQGLVASLEEQWRPRHEDVAKLSQQARQVVMRVTIEHNGRLGNIHILQSSPSGQLNDSAVAAVHASAPFKPLPSAWGLERAHFYFVFEMVEDKFVFRTL
ncbi:MAG: TonB family protein [Mariprofundaceae bacterium]|nr:TonB family protein [Mariprofundaceae bacterium]